MLQRTEGPRLPQLLVLLAGALWPVIAGFPGVLRPAGAASPTPAPEVIPPALDFAPPVHLSVGGSPQAIAIADFDGDGLPDLAVSNPGTGDVSILLGTGDGAFAPESRMELGPIAQAMAAADFDGDGLADLAATSFGSGSQAGEIYVATGYGDGFFAPAVGYDAGLHPGFLVTADVDGDGEPDLATASSDGGLTVLLNLGGGSFGPPLHVRPDTPFSVQLSALATGEFDDDGFTDLAFTAYYPYECASGGAVVWVSLGDGRFVAQPGLDAICPQDVLAGDLDSDGLDDLTVLTLEHLWLRLNLGAATFGPPVGVMVPEGAQRALFGDFNGDGLQDLAVGGATDVVSVLPGLGGTSFGAGIQLLLVDEFRSMASVDLDGDGATDLVLTEPNLGSISLFLTGTPPVNAPPVAAAGPDAAIECTSPAGGSARLDGTASTDADSTPGTNDDIVAFRWYEDFGQPSEALLATGAIADLTLAVGTHSITLRVTDRAGAFDSDQVEITIVDTVPPALMVGLKPSTLWPPNHRMVDVAATIAASDLCGPVAVVLDAIVSSESDDAPGRGDGETAMDIRGADLGTADDGFRLRAERAGGGGGRVYTATYRATDAAGNVSVSAPFVAVPHDLYGLVEPIVLSAIETGSGTTLAWDEVTGSVSYDVVRGEVGSLARGPESIILGPLICLASAITAPHTIGREDESHPPLGEAFFYLVAFDDGSSGGYGTESAATDRAPIPGPDCP